MPLADELARADRQIAEIEEQIRGQYQLIARLTANGFDTSLAKALLKRMLSSRSQVGTATLAARTHYHFGRTTPDFP
jgi:hypothetical protein